MDTNKRPLHLYHYSLELSTMRDIRSIANKLREQGLPIYRSIEFDRGMLLGLSLRSELPRWVTLGLQNEARFLSFDYGQD